MGQLVKTEHSPDETWSAVADMPSTMAPANSLGPLQNSLHEDFLSLFKETGLEVMASELGVIDNTGSITGIPASVDHLASPSKALNISCGISTVSGDTIGANEKASLDTLANGSMIPHVLADATRDVGAHSSKSQMRVLGVRKLDGLPLLASASATSQHAGQLNLNGYHSGNVCNGMTTPARQPGAQLTSPPQIQRSEHSGVTGAGIHSAGDSSSNNGVRASHTGAGFPPASADVSGRKRKTLFPEDSPGRIEMPLSKRRSTTMMQKIIARRSPKNVTASEKNKGLRHFSLRVCEKVEAKGKTTYNEVAEELVTELRVKQPDAKGAHDSKNIRRRVYDALNVLMSVDIIRKDRKEITWAGFPDYESLQGKPTPQESQETLQRLDRKRSHLSELLLQHYCIRQLIEHNKKSSSSSSAVKKQEPAGDDPNQEDVDDDPATAEAHGEQWGITDGSDATRITTPFILVKTGSNTDIACEISDDRNDINITLSSKFVLIDDTDLLRSMGLDQNAVQDAWEHKIVPEAILGKLPHFQEHSPAPPEEDSNKSSLTE